MADESIARVYAQAIFEKALERWRRELRAVNNAVEDTGSLTNLDNPAEAFDRKKELVSRALPANADGEVRNFLYLLASKNELHLLPEVLVELDRLMSRGPARQLVRVTSSVELNDEERKKLEEKTRKQFGQDLDFEYRVDKDLLGGVMIRIGDKVIDGSVKGKLDAMRAKLEAVR
jgi:F-type H+-transporting ATPase subunit delta